MNIISITTDKGVTMNIRLIGKGETYGFKKCLVHDKDEPLVEFYDARYTHDPEGQFIARYSLGVLDGTSEWSNGGISNGLCLQGDVPEWTVDAKACQKVLGWLKFTGIN